MAKSIKKALNHTCECYGCPKEEKERPSAPSPTHGRKEMRDCL